MKRSFKRVIAVLLAVTMLVPYAGCGKKSSEVVFNKNAIYKEEQMAFELEDNTEIGAVAKVGDNLIISAYKYDYEKGTAETKAYQTDLNGNIVKELSFGFDNANYFYLNNIIEAENGDYFYTCYVDNSDYTDPDNPVYDSSEYLVSANIDGTVYKKITVQETGLDYFDASASVPGGRLLLTCDSKIFIFDKDLNRVKEGELSGVNWINRIFTGRDGKIYISYYNDEGSVLKSIDPETLEVSDEIKITVNMNMYDIYGSGKDYDMYLRADSGIFGYNFADQQLVEVFNFIDSDISASYFNFFIVLEDGTFLSSYTDWDDSEADSYKTYLCRYTKVDPSDVVEKEIISLGCLWLDSQVRKDVIKFNKTNDKYRISVKDYSMYETEDDYDGGLKKMNADIAAGQAPDIIVSGYGTDVMNYASKGLFADLYKFIDEDPELSRDGFFENILKALEYNGKLTVIAPTFYVSSLAGKTSKLGNRTGWTFDEMAEFSRNLPEGSQLMFASTREDFLNQCISIDMQTYINTAEHKCNFDTPEFKSLLNFVKDLPARTDDYYDKLYSEYEDLDYSSMYRNDMFILADAYITGFDSYKNIKQSTFGEDITFIGYPSASGNGSAISLYGMYSISAKCSHPEAAWEFVRMQLTDEAQSKVSYGIPITLKAFNALAEESMKEPEQPEGGIEGPILYGKYYDDYQSMKPLTQAEVDQFTDFIKSVTTYTGTVDENILNIIYEEAAPFFEGQKSVDDVASIIQSRLSIYINEKK